MISKKIIIKNPTGLHLRPAGILCNEAVKYKSRVYFKYGDNEANAKSVLSVLGACIRSGTELEFIFDGEDEKEAMEGVLRVVQNGLGE